MATQDLIPNSPDDFLGYGVSQVTAVAKSFRVVLAGAHYPNVNLKQEIFP
jgi:hypothetical protein